jgi:hypothetical protein
MVADDFVIYQQGAGYVYGVPARNLTREEWEGLSDGERDVALRSGIYQLAAEPSRPEQAAVSGGQGAKKRNGR